MGKYARIPTNTWQNLVLGAGFLTRNFNPATGHAPDADMIGATTGGIQFTDNVTYKDFAENVDNAPKNMKEFKRTETHEVTISGTFIALDPDTLPLLIASATVSGDANYDKFVPNNDIAVADFRDLWFVSDYSDKTGAINGGFLAIKLLNALNTGGLSIKTADEEKGEFAFTFTGHYSIEAQDTVPYEIYMHAGTAEPSAFSITSTAVENDDDTTLITASEAAGSGNKFVITSGTHVRQPNVGEVVAGSGWTTWDNSTSGETYALNGWEVAVAVVNQTTLVCVKSAKTIAVVWEDTTT